SKDGTRLIYRPDLGSIADSQLFLRNMSDMDGRPIPTTEGAVWPVFSPDGQWIAFYSERELMLKKIAVSGGPAVTLCKADAPLGIKWDGNFVVFAQLGKGIMRVSEDGGEPQVIVPVNFPEVAYGPHLLDGGRTVLFTLGTLRMARALEPWDKAQI